MANICNAALSISPPTDFGTYTLTLQIDFGEVELGSDLQPEITISNTGVNPLQVGDIASTHPVVAPFRLVDAGCANSIIQPGNHCSIMVLFEPTIADAYPGSFNIEIASGDNHVVLLNGVGVALADEPDIQVSFASLNLGFVDVLEDTDIPYSFPPAGSPLPIITKNIGSLPLDISSLSVTGPDAAEVTVLEDCVAVMAPDEMCGFSIEFKPLSPGVKNAAVSIVSDDPDEGLFNMLIKAIVAGEDDGVPAEIEDLGPNNGDGNNDDVLDSRQSNVATLLDSYGHYVTYLADRSYRFSNMSVTQQIETPTDFIIGSGTFDFTLEQVTPGQTVEIGVILPAGLIPGAYYIYGPTADNPVKHWSKFDFDEETGAIILGDVVFTASSGSQFTRSVLKLIVQDGGRGDTDMTVNGVIAVTAAMPLSTDDDSGSINLWYMIFTFLLIMFLRRIFNHC